MLVESKGIKINEFYVPPFTLAEGEIVVLFLYGGAHFCDLSRQLTDIFTSKIKLGTVNIRSQLAFVEHYKERKIRSLFFPLTVGEYIVKYGNHDNDIAQTIYEDTYIKPQTKLISLAGTPRKLLSLYTTLSHTNKLIFDLTGIDPLGAEKIYEVVKHNVREGGAAILLDNTDDMKDDCTKFIAVEIDEKLSRYK